MKSRINACYPARIRSFALCAQDDIAGFTLLEVLIAVFIFSIISVILVTALHNALKNQSATQNNAAQFAELQLSILLIQRDIEQIVDRPINDETGNQENTLIGGTDRIEFTHTGFANPGGQLNRSNLQRTLFYVEKNKLIRRNWALLDRTAHTPSSQRILLENIKHIGFQYLDKNNRFQNHWPPDPNKSELPKAIRIVLTLEHQGKLSQLFIIPGQPLANTNPTPSPAK